VNLRIKYYLNTGFVCFCIGFVLTHGIGEELTIPVLLVFNYLILTRFRRDYRGPDIYLIALISTVFTVSVFIVQYEYRKFVDWGCIKLIPDFEANNSYLTTMVIFTIILWELGFACFKQGNEQTGN